MFETIEEMEKVLRNQFAVQKKIFTYLNAYAKNQHMVQWSRVDPHSVLGQVYGDLGACFSELEAVVAKLGPEKGEQEENQ